MPGMTRKRLDAVQKTLEASFFDDTDALDQLQKSFEGLHAAIEKGETVTMDDLTDILGDVVVSKMTDEVDDHGGGTANAEDEDPIAPVMKTLHAALFDGGKIRKGLDQKAAEAALQSAYETILKAFDEAIEQSVDATLAKLAKDGLLRGGEDSGKRRGARDKDEDCDDMNDLMKSLAGKGVSEAVIKKIGGLQAEVDGLKAERDLERFEKMAEGIGEGKAFGATLLKMHQTDPASVEEICKRLKAKNELLRKSKTWSEEIGREGGAAGGSAYEQLVAKANEAVDKGESFAKSRGGKVSFQKAFAEICSRHPDLYAEYRKEREQRR